MIQIEPLQSSPSNPSLPHHFEVGRLKLFLILLAMLCCHLIGYCQLIKGTVFDQETSEPIPFASVYFSGTTVGTTANASGYFELNYPVGLSNPLTISSVGYYSATLTNFQTNEKRSIKLQPKTIDLLGIEVAGDKSRNVRKKYFPTFRVEFLGKKLNPRECSIRNEGDVLIQYDRNNHLVKAFASHQIQIQNERLGYNISYFLDRFEYNLLTKSLIFIGNYIFTPMKARDSKQQAEFETNRLMAYLGSRMHLFRSLWDGSFALSGFVAINVNGNVIPPEKVGIGTEVAPNGAEQKSLIMLGTFGVYYKDFSRLTRMVLKDGSVHFDSNGYFDPMEIFWEGAMANKRISDLLPYEYVPDVDALKKLQEAP